MQCQRINLFIRCFFYLIDTQYALKASKFNLDLANLDAVSEQSGTNDKISSIAFTKALLYLFMVIFSCTQIETLPLEVLAQSKKIFLWFTVFSQVLVFIVLKLHVQKLLLEQSSNSSMDYLLSRQKLNHKF